jgi:hypothetical protein
MRDSRVKVIRSLPVDTSNIAPEKLKKVRDEVAAQIALEREKATLEAYKKELIRQERSKYDPSEELEEVTIELPKFAPYILLGENIYHDGTTVEVTRSVAQSLREIMYNVNLHNRLSRNPRDIDYKTTNQSYVSAATGFTRI